VRENSTKEAISGEEWVLKTEPYTKM